MSSRCARVLPLVLLSAGAAGSPLKGPGYDPDEGVLTDAEGPFLMIATHTRIAKGERSRFNDHVDAITRQQDRHEGFMARALRREALGRERWTMTMWEDEASAFDFTFSGAHLAAMQDADASIDGVYSASWWVEEDELPVVWPEVLDELDAVAPDAPW